MTAQHVARDIRRSRTRLPSFETWQAEWETIYPTKVSIVQAWPLNDLDDPESDWYKYHNQIKEFSVFDYPK